MNALINDAGFIEAIRNHVPYRTIATTYGVSNVTIKRAAVFLGVATGRASLADRFRKDPELLASLRSDWDDGVSLAKLAQLYGICSYKRVSDLAATLGFPPRSRHEPEQMNNIPLAPKTPRKCLRCGAVFMSPYPKSVNRICPTCTEEI